MMRRSGVYIIVLLFFISLGLHAQETVVPIITLTPSSTLLSERDTVRVSSEQLDFDESDLDKVTGLREQFEKQNNHYSVPRPPSRQLVRFMKKDKLEIPGHIMYWINWERDESTIIPEGVSFRDTMIVDPLFLPPIFKGKVLADKIEFRSAKDSLFAPFYTDKHEVKREPFFEKKKTQYAFDKKVETYMETTNPLYFAYSEKDLPTEIIAPVEMPKVTYETAPIVVQPEIIAADDMDAPAKFIPERLYWKSNFESAIQFSQNYVSPNWHKGGSSNLNLYTKNYLRYDYQKDKVQFTNEIEIKVSVYTAPKDTLRDYKIGDDVLRLHSNYGYKAFNKWFYTVDAEFKTQLFKNYKENQKELQAGFLAPFSINLGIGMKYDLNKKFTNKHKNLKLSVNMAPISYTFMYSVLTDNIDLGRHGFEKKPDSGQFEHQLSKFGSTLKADLTFKFNRNVSWESRLNYFTSYDRVLCDFENTLTMAISRFFSTRIYVNLRFDDAATKKEDFDSYLQVNELLSFGFNYKW